MGRVKKHIQARTKNLTDNIKDTVDARVINLANLSFPLDRAWVVINDAVPEIDSLVIDKESILSRGQWQGIANSEEEAAEAVTQKAKKSKRNSNDNIGRMFCLCNDLPSKIPAFLNPLLAKLDEIKSTKHTVCGHTYLFSSNSCPVQQSHRDYQSIPAGRKLPDPIPYSIVISLEEGTSIMVQFRGKMVNIQLPPGSAMLMRGDCLHAGAGYIHENLRMHVYIDTEDHQAVRGEIYGPRFEALKPKISLRAQHLAKYP